jgi:hypothetical protein
VRPKRVPERSAETNIEGRRWIVDALRMFRGNAKRVREVTSELRPKRSPNQQDGADQGASL